MMEGNVLIGNGVVMETMTVATGQMSPIVTGEFNWQFLNIVKLQLNSQLHLNSNPTPSPLQINSTPPRVELELCPIIGLHW